MMTAVELIEELQGMEVQEWATNMSFAWHPDCVVFEGNERTAFFGWAQDNPDKTCIVVCCKAQTRDVVFRTMRTSKWSIRERGYKIVLNNGTRLYGFVIDEHPVFSGLTIDAVLLPNDCDDAPRCEI